MSGLLNLRNESESLNVSEGNFYRIRGTINIIETIGEQPDDDMFARVHITREQFNAQELLRHVDVCNCDTDRSERGRD